MADDTTSPVRSSKPTNQKSARALAAFRARVEELGGTILEPSWLGGHTKHRVACANGHEHAVSPSSVLQGVGICPICAKAQAGAKKSRRAEEAFRAEVERQGGAVIGPYKQANKPAHVRCVQGHDAYPTPSNVMRGGGICRTCTGQNPDLNAERFRAAVERQGGTVVGTYSNARTPVDVICSQNHKCRVWPTYVVNQGGGICAVCSGRALGVSEDRYRQAVAQQGGEVLEPFAGVHHPTLVRCPEGHENRVTPNHVLRGVGICSTCTGNARGISEPRFRRIVEERGGQVLGPFISSSARVLVRCSQEHETLVKPKNVLSGQGMCRVCAGKDPATAERAFRARVEELGGTVLEPVWKGVGEKHAIRCAEGHVSYPLPTHVQQGVGICRLCAGKAWDAFYVVQDDFNDLIKFGITSGDPRPRLTVHAKDGFRQVLRIHTDLPGDTAPNLERNILAALEDARERPVRGREYFHVRVLPVVLDLVDHHPAIRA